MATAKKKTQKMIKLKLQNESSVIPVIIGTTKFVH